jgi:hypothetical protein
MVIASQHAEPQSGLVTGMHSTLPGCRRRSIGHDVVLVSDVPAAGFFYTASLTLYFSVLKARPCSYAADIQHQSLL